MSGQTTSQTTDVYTLIASQMCYRTAQIFDGGNIDEFDKFPAIRQYFPYQNFPFS